jgi:hypothetical protein
MFYPRLQWYWKWICLFVYYSANILGKKITNEAELLIRFTKEIAISRANHRQMLQELKGKIPK